MNKKFRNSFRLLSISVIAGLFAVLFTGGMTLAEQRTPAEGKVRQQFDKSIKGKTIAYLPIATGTDLGDAWWYQIRKGAERLGLKAIIRDPNWNTQAQVQAMSSLISEGVDLIIVQNQSVELLPKLLKKAEEAGIYVIQLSMSSNYPTDVFIGVDWFNVGVTIAEDIVKNFGKGSGTSGKVAIIQGELTSAASLGQLMGARSVFKKHPEIKVVNDQSANWQSQLAHDITATVLQQHPDLCCTYGMWDVMSMGAAQAVKKAGLSGKVLVYTVGGGPQAMCDNVQNGLFDKYWSWNSFAQGRDIMTAVQMLLQSGIKPGKMRSAIYTPISLITKDNCKTGCYFLPKD